MSTKNEALVQTYMNMYKSKGDNELHTIVSSNASQIALMSATGTSVAQADMLLAQMEAANRITYLRTEKKKAEINALIEFRNTLEIRKKKAILNLKAAASSNGQLITAILEDEDGKTADEFMDWEELAELGEDGIKALLDELCKEGMIEIRDDGKYYLLEVLNVSLIPRDIVRWGLRKAFGICPEDISKLTSDQKKVALILETFPPNKAMSASEYLSEIEFYLDFSEWEGYSRYSKSDFSSIKGYGTSNQEQRVDSNLRQLAGKGILKEFGNGNAYAVAFLGEEV